MPGPRLIFPGFQRWHNSEAVAGWNSGRVWFGIVLRCGWEDGCWIRFGSGCLFCSRWGVEVMGCGCRGGWCGCLDVDVDLGGEV